MCFLGRGEGAGGTESTYDHRAGSDLSRVLLLPCHLFSRS